MKLGIIGMSEGNGHPYSWSAIFNHYNDEAMRACQFPIIYDYLSKKKWPTDYITGSEVTHIWTQDRALSQQIAAASNIPHIADNFTDMIGAVDALLLARDDYKNHETFARPFIEAGMPIYIDKPLANKCSDALKLFSWERYTGQIFSCSALRYASEFDLISKRRSEIIRVEASTPKIWDLYAIHIIEPVFALLGDVPEMKILRREIKDDGAVLLEIETPHQTLLFQSTGEKTGTIRYHIHLGDGSVQSISISDYFHAFRGALVDFLKSVQTRSPVIDRTQTLSIIQTIEMGTKSS